MPTAPSCCTRCEVRQRRCRLSVGHGHTWPGLAFDSIACAARRTGARYIASPCCAEARPLRMHTHASSTSAHAGRRTSMRRRCHPDAHRLRHRHAYTHTAHITQHTARTRTQHTHARAHSTRTRAHTARRARARTGTHSHTRIRERIHGTLKRTHAWARARRARRARRLCGVRT